jgi:hypothetical protein
MAKFALLARDNRVSAFYDSAIHEDAIPAAAIEITDSLWEEWIGQADSVIYDAKTEGLSPYVAPPAPPPSKADLIAYAANKRWQVETGGITVNGARIDTSRESQDMIDKAYALSKEDPVEIVSYKAASGFVEIDAATIKAIAIAVGRHVRACFAAEKLMADAIAAGTVTDFAKIDSAWTV